MNQRNYHTPWHHESIQIKRKKNSKDGYIYARSKKGMYGLKEAAILAYNWLVKFMKEHGYCHVPGTAGIWKHQTKLIVFCLCVDNIGVKYYYKKDAQHLINILDY